MGSSESKTPLNEGKSRGNGISEVHGRNDFKTSQVASGVNAIEKLRKVNESRREVSVGVIMKIPSVLTHEDWELKTDTR